MKAFIAADESLALTNWTLGDLLEHAAAKAPDRIAIRQPAQAPDEVELNWTYAELLEDSRRLARFLITRFDRGDHVVMWASNRAEWILYQFAAALAGITLVTANPALRTHEMRYLLSHSRAAGILMDKEHRRADLTTIIASLRPEIPTLREVLYLDDMSDHLAANGDAPLPDDISPAETAMILYTSGTTGKPKAVRLHHGGIVENARLSSLRYELGDGAVWLHTLPMYHVGGSATYTLGAIAQLATTVVLKGFDPGAVLRLCESERIALIPAVPTMLIAMIENERFPETDLSSLRVFVTGGTIITPEFVRLARAKLGCEVYVMFGQTEAGGSMCLTKRSDTPELIASSVGVPCPHTALKIARPGTDETCDSGEVGEIRISSPFMMQGYFDNEEANASAFDHDGYLRTGDLGFIGKDGYVRVTGRLKEMIIRGGENIYPREVEDALSTYPGVSESAVFGLPDSKWGEEVAVAVRGAAGVTLDAELMTEYLRGQIARHKVPKRWMLVEDFPRTASGKIKKFALIDLFTDGPSGQTASD